jgi:4'-phosphopantetheinyl transferase
VSLSALQTPPRDLSITENEVHVWIGSLEPADSVIEYLAQTLSPDEVERARRFRFEHLRRRFIAGRGMLRDILGRYTRIEPVHIKFAYGMKGKPRLAQDSSAIRFNLAHSGPLAVYAIAKRREVGVDLEQTHPLDDFHEVARRYFSQAEYAALAALPTSQHIEGFFNCWTRKEAYIKALGDGLSFPLDQFEVTLRPGDPPQLLRVNGAPQEVTRWKLEAFYPAEGYTAALIAEGQRWSLAQWRWDKTVP